MVRLVAVSGISSTLTLAPAQTSPPRRMILPALPLPPAGLEAMAEVSAPLKPSKASGLASSKVANITSPLTGGGVILLKACECVLDKALALLLRSA